MQTVSKAFTTFDIIESQKQIWPMQVDDSQGWSSTLLSNTQQVESCLLFTHSGLCWKWEPHQTCVRYISGTDERLFLIREKPCSAIRKPHFLQFSNKTPDFALWCLLCGNTVRHSSLSPISSLIQGTASNIDCENELYSSFMTPSCSNFTRTLHALCSAFLKNKKTLTFVSQQGGRCSEWHSLGLTHYNDVPSFSSFEENESCCLGCRKLDQKTTPTASFNETFISCTKKRCCLSTTK